MITHEILVAILMCAGRSDVDFDDDFGCDAYSSCHECCEDKLSEYEDSIKSEARENALNEVRKRVMETIGHKVWETSSNAFKTAFNKIIDEVLAEYEKEQTNDKSL